MKSLFFTFLLALSTYSMSYQRIGLDIGLSYLPGSMDANGNQQVTIGGILDMKVYHDYFFSRTISMKNSIGLTVNSFDYNGAIHNYDPSTYEILGYYHLNNFLQFGAGFNRHSQVSFTDVFGNEIIIAPTWAPTFDLRVSSYSEIVPRIRFQAGISAVLRENLIQNSKVSANKFSGYIGMTW